MANEQTDEGELTQAQRAEAFNAGLAQRVEALNADLAGGATETPQAQPEAVQPPEMAQITQEQWLQAQARMARIDRLDEFEATTTKRGLDTAFGKVGALTQALDKLKGAPGAVDDADFTDLAQDFPELVPLLVKGINSAAKKGSSQAPDMTAIEALVSARSEAEVAKVTDAFDLRLATMQLEQKHGDWRAIVNEAGFQSLVATKPADVQARLMGRDHEFVSEFITDYKTAKAKLVSADTRRDRFNAAVTTQGTGNADAPAGQSRRDHFMSGLKKGH